MPQPSAAMESASEEQTADGPVSEHADPYSHRTHAKISHEKDTERDTADPHADTRKDH